MAGTPALLLATIGARAWHAGRGAGQDPTPPTRRRSTTYGPLSAEDGTALRDRAPPPAEGRHARREVRGVDDRTAAEKLNGLSLFVARTALPAPEADEFYYADLIGLEAVAPAGAPLGTVVAVENYGAGDILEIAPPPEAHGPSLLVPFTKAVVPDIDIEAGRIVVVPPDEVEAREEEP